MCPSITSNTAGTRALIRRILIRPISVYILTTSFCAIHTPSVAFARLTHSDIASIFVLLYTTLLTSAEPRWEMIGAAYHQSLTTTQLHRTPRYVVTIPM